MLGDIIIANVLASAFLVLFIYIFDFNEKEPPWTLVRLYIFSILLTFCFGKLKGILFSHYQWEFLPWFSNFVIAGFFEELLKFLVVMIFAWRLKSFNDESDGIVYYLFVAAGFTVLENLGYSFHFVLRPYIYGLQTGEMGFYKQALQQIVILRAVSGHIFINVVSGVFLGLAKRKSKIWILLPGFILSVLLHGLWNTMAMTKYMGWFALAFLIMDGVLFILLVRHSFYFKFIRRLKRRLKDLIREAENFKIDEDVIILMTGIKNSLNALRQLEGDQLKSQARTITELLPPRVDKVWIEGKDGLIERLIKVNGMLGRDKIKTGKYFYFGLFLRFCIPGFILLTILIVLM